MANDLVVPANKDFSLEKISFNTMVEMGKPVNSVDLYFYKDSGNGPGKLISSQLGVVPSSTKNLGVFNNFDRLTVSLTFPNPVLFQGNSFQTIYWVAMKLNYDGGLSYLEVTKTNMNTPNPIYLFDPNKDKFEAAPGDPTDGVLSLKGTCTDIPVCSADPNAGIVNGPSRICAGTDFTLAVENPTQGQANLTYQWQTALSGSNDWQNIAGATFFELKTNTNVARDYRFTVQCGTSAPIASNIISVEIKPQGECHCIPLFSSGCTQFNDYIKDFILTGINGTEIKTLNTDCPDGSYEMIEDAIVDLSAGSQFIAQISAGSTDEYAVAWIDFDDNGEFSQGEKVGSVGAIGENLKNMTIFIPAIAKAGKHVMRLMLQYSQSPSSPCTPDGPWGMTRDYFVNVIAAANCEGTPTAGTASGPELVCKQTAFTISVAGSSQAGGLKFHWESSPAGQNTWTTIPNSQNLNFNVSNGVSVPTDFRFYMECEASGKSVYSNVISVTLKAVSDCYCIPAFYGGCTYNDVINTVAVKDANNNTVFENNSACDSINGYSDFSQSKAPIDVKQGESYTFNIKTSAPEPQNEQLRVWVDFNVNGQFENNEEIYYTGGLGFNTDGTTSFNFNVDPNLAAGEYRIRFRLNYGGYPPVACDLLGYGEAEDYTLKVLPKELGTQDHGKTTVYVYPNPVHDVLKISTSERVLDVTVYALDGKLVKSVKSANEVDMTNLTAGTYVVKVKTSASEKTYKVIKK